MLDALDRARALARAQLSLSPLECQIVRALCRGPRTIGDLSRHLAANRSSISMAAQRLEQRAALTREVANRRTTLHLSAEVQRQYVELGYAPIRAGVEQWLEHQDPHDDARAEHALQLLQMMSEVFDRTREDRRSREASDELHAALRRGDAERATALATALVTDRQTRGACHALTAALHRVGDADLALLPLSADAVERLQALVRPSSLAPARGQRAFVCNGVGESHTLALRVIGGELERHGWHVDLMIGSMPIQDLVDLCRRTAADAVFVGVTLDANVPATEQLVRELARVAPVYVGGQAFDEPAAAQLILSAGASRHVGLDDLESLAA